MMLCTINFYELQNIFMHNKKIKKHYLIGIIILVVTVMVVVVAKKGNKI
jgi:uncharacterized membrane protein